MNRKELQRLSRIRIDDACALADRKHWSGAYYLAGYSVECAVKACIAKKIRSGVIPERNFDKEFYSHDLNALAKFAGLISNNRLVPGTEFKGNQRSLELNWGITKDWKETARYETWSKQRAIDLIEAITHTQEGVLAWLQLHW